MGFVVALAIVGFVIFLTVRLRRRDYSPGPGAFGTVHDMLNEDQQRAIQIIVEQRAEARDPEDADGNLPELEKPNR